jgi:hypothetical protein
MFAHKHGWRNSSHNARCPAVLSKTDPLFKLGFKRAIRKYVKIDVICFDFVDGKY